MIQFDNPYANPYMDPMTQPRKTSGLAITALVFSLIGIVPCCFFAAPIGVLLGVIAVATIGSNPLRKGKGLGWSAVIIGLIFSVLWIGAGYWVYHTVSKPMQEGPKSQLEAGFAGNVSTFKSGLFGQAATASDADAKHFIDTLRSRFGEFRNCHLDETAMNTRGVNVESMMNPVQNYPYRFQFSNKVVKGEVELTWMDPQTGQFAGGVLFGRMVLKDPDTDEEIVYPPGSQPTANPARKPSRRGPTTATDQSAPAQSTPASSENSSDGG